MSQTTEPSVIHLAGGTTPKTTSRKPDIAAQSSKRGPESISSRLEEMELGGTTKDDLSVKGSVADSIDSDTEKELLISETDTANMSEATKKNKKEKTQYERLARTTRGV